MSNVWHRIPCCRSKWEQKHGKGGGEKKDPFFMKITYLGDGNNPVNFLVKKVDGFGDTYDLDESSINRMTLDGVEIKFEDLTLANKGEYGGTYDVYQYNFGDNSEHELIIYSDSQDTLRFSPWYGNGPVPKNSAYFKNITKIEISNNILNISKHSFNGCSILVSIIIPDSIIHIGEGAFNACSNLIFSINIPNTITSIGDYTFCDCRGLTSVEIPNSVTSIGKSAFSYCRGLTSVEIPNSVTSIGGGAFNGCTSLTSVTISNSVTSINYQTFRSCSSLTSIEIPNSVTSMDSFAFADLTLLTSILIPESLTSIGYACFSGCSNLESVTVLPITPPSMIGGSYYGGIFKNTSANLVIYVPAESVDAYKSATGWSTYADRIQAIPIPNNTIKYTASEKLAEISGYNTGGINIDYIDANIINHTFKNGVGTIEFDGDITRIKDGNGGPPAGAFNNTNITSITIPNSVTFIGNQSFASCSNLTSINIPNGVTTIGNYTFFRCSSLTSITIPNSVTIIGSDAFADCTSLTSITIPNSVMSIGNSAFWGCSSLTSVEIPNSVTSIGGGAFYNCSSLTSITSLATTAPTIQSSTFQDVKSNGTLYVPIGSTGYDVWMSTENYYLGLYNWTKVEQ